MVLINYVMYNRRGLLPVLGIEYNFRLDCRSEMH